MPETTAVRADAGLAAELEGSAGKRASVLVPYRGWVSDHSIAAALLAGVVATHMATAAGYWMFSFGLPQLDWNRANGRILTPTASPDVQFLSGAMFHYIDGVIFAVLFAVAVHPILLWRSTAFGNALKGLALGTILATISCVWMNPRVYAPDAAGFFSHNFGWKFILAVYIWHWVFGLHLGIVYNPLERRTFGFSRR